MEDVMSGKQTMRCLCFWLLIFLLLVSCQGGQAIPTASPSPNAITEIESSATPSSSNTPRRTTPLSVTETGTQTWTSTIPPEGYALRDWREPVEVITPENMDRVERIGELEFADNVGRFAFSPDGSWMGVHSFGNVSIILNPFTFEEKWEFQPSFGLIAFSYDGLILETGGITFDLTTGEKISEGMSFHPSRGAIMDIEFSPNGQYMVAAGSELLEIHPLKSGIEWGSFGRDIEPWHASVSPDSNLIAVNYRFDNFTELWNPFLRRPVRILKMKEINGQGKPRFSKDGRSLFFTGNGTWEEQEVIFFQEWDYLSDIPLHVQMIPGSSWEADISMDISPVSQLASLGTTDGKIYLFPFRDCRAIKIGDIGQSEKTYENRIDMVTFRPDGELLATSKWGGNKIEFWGIPAGEEGKATAGPVENPTETPAVCPNIPMIVEHPTPDADWWGGGQPRQ
jgi:WD40 repeat protein